MPPRRTDSLQLKLYESLTLRDPVQVCDLIFAFAGRPERKRYALELYRAGVAPRLLFSVGRFEVSRMRGLPLAGIDDLIALRDRTAPRERHFFLEITRPGATVRKVELPRWNTYGEACGLRDFLLPELPRTVTVISTDVHMRRIALSLDTVFRRLPVRFAYCPVPAAWQPFHNDDWWTRPEERRFVVKEMVKYAGYRTILSIAEFAHWFPR